MQKALADSRAFLLLAAVLTVTQTRRKRNWSSCSQQELHLDAGIAGHAEPQASKRPDPGPVGRAGHTGPGSQDQADVTGLVLAGPCGDRSAGVWVNTWTRGAGTYPGFMCSSKNLFPARIGAIR